MHPKINKETINTNYRSKESQKRRKSTKRAKNALRRKQAISLLKEEKIKVNQIEVKLEKEKKKVENLKSQLRVERPGIFSSVSRNMVASRSSSKSLTTSLPSCAQLSEDVLVVTDVVLGGGTFGIVKLGHLKTLHVNCAVKIGKFTQFDAVRECRILQKLQGCRYFPFVFGVMKNMLIMEYVGSDDNVRTVSSEMKCSSITQEAWLNICLCITIALRFMHSNGLLHNDIKANNILLNEDTDGALIPKLIDMGKTTTKREPPVYKLTLKQKERYNKLHSYLAPELRNEYGAKCSIYTDIFSLGVVFSCVADSENTLLQSLISKMSNVVPNSRPNTDQVYRILKKHS